MEIENLNLLKNLEGEELEVDINVGGVISSYFINEAHIESNNNEIIVDDLSDEIVPIHINKQFIASVEKDFSNTIEIHMLYGQVNFIQM